MALIQVGPQWWVDEVLAARKGLRRYAAPPKPAAPRAGATPQRAGAGKTPAPIKPRAAAPPQPRRPPPRDIVEAMRRGMSNREIDALVARGALRRPRNIADAGWSPADWRAAQQRGLVW